jgi:hypothetical protein
VVGEIANHQACGWVSSLSPRMWLEKYLITKNMVGEVANYQECD